MWSSHKLERNLRYSLQCKITLMLETDKFFDEFSTLAAILCHSHDSAFGCRNDPAVSALFKSMLQII